MRDTVNDQSGMRRALIIVYAQKALQSVGSRCTSLQTTNVDLIGVTAFVAAVVERAQPLNRRIACAKPDRPFASDANR